MATQIIRVQGVKSSSSGGLRSHDFRLKQPKTNPDIEPSRTPLNYVLEGNKANTYDKFVHQRWQELGYTKALRSDANVLANIVISASPDFFKDNDRREFFEDSLAFLGRKYGKENICSAVVHLDEKTPHMHVQLVPVNDKGRISYDSLFNNVKGNKLTKLQNEFSEQVGTRHDLERGTIGSSRKHLTPQDYKDLTEYQSNIALQPEKADIELEIPSKVIYTRNDVKQLLETVVESKNEELAAADQRMQAVSSIVTKSDFPKLEKENKKLKNDIEKVKEWALNKVMAAQAGAETVDDLKNRITELETENKFLKIKIHEVGEWIKAVAAHLLPSQLWTRTIQKLAQEIKKPYPLNDVFDRSINHNKQL